MQVIDKFIITGDLFRVNSDNVFFQDRNIKWLYNLIKPALEMCSNFRVDLLCNSTEGKNPLSRAFYKARGLEINLKNWAILYDSIPTDREIALVHQKFSKSLVITFEMPENLKKALDFLDIPYIDFTIHAVRFMDDLIFGLRTNITGLEASVSRWTVSDDEIKLSAGLAMATLGQLPVIAEFLPYENVGVFCGQTMDDKVLIKNGSFIEVEDMLDYFSDMCLRHDKIFVKPHPFSKENKMILALTRLFKNTHLINKNFYHILSQENVSTIYSVNSSTSIEAAFLGKNGIHFSLYPYFFSEKFATGGSFLSIKPDIFDPNFWEAILSDFKVNTKKSSVNSVVYSTLPPMRNRIRYSLQSFWGADVFDKIN